MIDIVRAALRPVIKRLKKLYDFRLPAGALSHSSRFLVDANLTPNAENFSFALRDKIKKVQHRRILVAHEDAVLTDTATFRIKTLPDVLVVLATLIRGNFVGELTLDLPKITGFVTIPANLAIKQEESLHRMYALEIDKAIRILRSRGVSVTSNVKSPPVQYAPHRNQLLNTTPSNTAIPNHKITLTNYSTDRPEFLGYNYRYPEEITYSFNDSGYRNDFEHDAQEAHSIVLGE